jgi:hypothetical protein
MIRTKAWSLKGFAMARRIRRTFDVEIPMATDLEASFQNGKIRVKSSPESISKRPRSSFFMF